MTRALAPAYRQCAAITRGHATTYYWGTALLPASQRRHVYAVYALCRSADDIVDAPGAASPQEVAVRLARYAEDFRDGLAGRTLDDPVLAAAVHTTRAVGIDPGCFDRFFAAMTMDLTRTRYETYENLCSYMDGSAAVIGEMMLPVLHPLDRAAIEPARALGLAFQLTNFLRDVDEDLDRGRVYLPQDELRHFGVRLEDRRVTPQWRHFMAFQIDRVRCLYDEADAGLALLPGRAARCVRTARILYSRILDRVERNDYDIFSGRLRVPSVVKVTTAARQLVMPAAAAGTAR